MTKQDRLKRCRELPAPYASCICDVCNFIKENGVIPEHSLRKAGLAVVSLKEK